MAKNKSKLLSEKHGAIEGLQKIFKSEGFFQGDPSGIIYKSILTSILGLILIFIGVGILLNIDLTTEILNSETETINSNLSLIAILSGTLLFLGMTFMIMTLSFRIANKDVSLPLIFVVHSFTLTTSLIVLISGISLAALRKDLWKVELDYGL